MGKLAYPAILICLIVTVFNISEASFKNIPPNKNNVKSFKQTLQVEKKYIKKLEKQLKDFEKNLGKSNQRYLNVLDKKKTVERAIVQGNKRLSISFEKLAARESESKKKLTLLLVNTFGEESLHSGDLLVKKVLINSLQRDIKKLQATRKEYSKLAATLSSLKIRFSEYYKLESELLTLINTLEYQKKKSVSDYMHTTRRRDQLAKKLKNYKNKSKSALGLSKARKMFGTFNSPIDSFVDLDHGKKGVYYIFRGNQSVHATRKGKITYSGSLSTYGNVVMIDHGKDLRSVIIGQFRPKVKQGQYVKTRQVLGYTYQSAGEKGRIYFEVRKNQKAQKTIELLDGRLLRKNNITI